MFLLPFLLLLSVAWAAHGQIVDNPNTVTSTVVVLGAPEPVTEGESARSVVLLDTRAHPLAVSTPEDYLRTDSSLYIEQRGAGLVQSDISLRGGSSAQTLVLLNGLRINDAESSHLNLDLPVPLAAIGNIEVLHGAGSALYGADALTGVVDFITAPVTADTLKLRAGVGSYGQNEQGLMAGTLRRRWSETLAGERTFSTGFMPDRDYRSESASSDARLTSALGETEILLAGSDQAFGANQFYGNYNSWERTKGWFASAHQAFGRKTDAAFGYRRHTDNFILLRNDPGAYANQHIVSGWQAVLRRKQPIRSSASLFYGVEAQGDSINSNNLGIHARNRGAGYIDLDWRPARRATVSAGLREEILSAGAQSVLSPDLAGSLWVGQSFKLRAATGYGFRLPTYTELYYSDPTRIGNAGLQPESAWSAEVGMDWYPNANTAASVTVFYERQHHTIDYVRAPSDRVWQASNLTGVSFGGVESSVDWRPRRNQRLRFSWTVLSGEQSALHGLQSLYVFNYPVNNAGAEWIGSIGRGFIARNRVGVTERYARDPYPVWDLSISRDRGWLLPYFRVANASNTGYEEIEGVRMQGRSFTGGIEISLSHH